MWTEQAFAVLREYRARKEAEDRLWQKIGRPEALRRRDEFLLPVGEEVGNLLHALIVAAGAQRIVELGTSYGFSTLFLANAARLTGGRVYSFDVAGYKQQVARAALTRAGLVEQVEFLEGDALELLADFAGPVDFALLDIWKEGYIPCFDLLYPKLGDRALVAADNMLYPEVYIEAGRAYQAHVLAHPDMDSVLLGVGSGVELSSRWPEFATGRQEAADDV